MNDRSAEVERMPHEHRECGTRERVWLAKDGGSSASAAKHPYCVRCGTVRNLTWPKAKPLGYYLSGVAALKEYLERSPIHPKLARVQGHLITTRLAARHEFEDPYGVSGQAQIDAYLGVIRALRRDLDEELLIRLLPHPRKQGPMAVPWGKESTTAG